MKWCSQISSICLHTSINSSTDISSESKLVLFFSSFFHCLNLTLWLSISSNFVVRKFFSTSTDGQFSHEFNVISIFSVTNYHSDYLHVVSDTWYHKKYMLCILVVLANTHWMGTRCTTHWYTPLWLKLTKFWELYVYISSLFFNSKWSSFKLISNKCFCMCCLTPSILTLQILFHQDIF